MRVVKRILVFIIVLPFILIGLFFMVRYLGYLKDPDPDKTFILPHLELAVFNVTNMNEVKTDVDARLLIDNPMPVGFTADSISYEIFITGQSIAKSSHRKSARIKGADTSWIVVPLTLYTEKLVNILEANEAKGVDSVDYEIRAAFYTDLVFKRQFDITVKRKLPLLYIPEVEVTKIEIDPDGLTELRLFVHTRIENKNVFDIESEDIVYQFSVAGHPWVKGTEPVSVEIPANSTAEVVFPVKVQLKEVGATAFTLLKNRRNIGYDLELSLRLGYEEDVLSNSIIVIKSKGVISELVDVVRKDKGERKKEKKKDET
jgi:LEA14-like dessication related protein